MAVYLGNLKILSGTQGQFNNVVQTVGDSAQDVMSQKATTYNTSTQYGKCIQVNASNQKIALTDEQVTRLNNCNVISVRVVQRGTSSTQYENRYVDLTGGIESTYGFRLKFYFDSKLHYRQYQYGQAAGAINKIDSTIVCPDVYTVVADRINGTVKYYAGNTLCTTLTNDALKSDYFVPTTQKYITLGGGDVAAKFYDVQIYDCDLSDFFVNATVNSYNIDTAGAQTLLYMFHGAYQQPTTYTDAKPSVYTGQTVGSWTYSWSGNTKIMTYTGTITSGNRVAGGYYIGGTDDVHAYHYKTYITVTGGNIKVYNQTGNITNRVLGVYDASTNVAVADITNIPSGSYYIYGTKVGANAWWIEAVSGEPVVQQTKDSWKRAACLFHLKGDVLYNGKLYDDEVDTFYTLPTSCNLNSTSLREPLVKQTFYQGIYPHYFGEIKVDKYSSTNKIYSALDYVTWKQINNS